MGCKKAERVIGAAAEHGLGFEKRRGMWVYVCVCGDATFNQSQKQSDHYLAWVQELHQPDFLVPVPAVQLRAQLFELDNHGIVGHDRVWIIVVVVVVVG